MLREPDVMIGNLEGVIGTGGAAKCPPGTPNCFAFQAPPAAADTLAWAGFEVMNIANNHANDYGPGALRETLGHLRDAGVQATGAPGRITTLRRRGLTVAVLGFAAYPWAARLDDIPAAVALVRRARRNADVVVVTMHAGAEGVGETHTPLGEEVAFGEARGDTRAFAHAVVDAGASVVLGSGPHVIRGVERHRGGLIVYSTGNFAGYHTFPTAGLLGLSAVVTVRIDARGEVLERTVDPAPARAAGAAHARPGARREHRARRAPLRRGLRAVGDPHERPPRRRRALTAARSTGARRGWRRRRRRSATAAAASCARSRRGGGPCAG